MYTKSFDKQSICRGPTVYLHQARVSHRCTKNLLPAVHLHPASISHTFHIDIHEILWQAQHLQSPAVHLHPASVSDPRTQNPMTDTAFAELKPFTCTQATLHIHVHEIPWQAQPLQTPSCLPAPSQPFTLMYMKSPDTHSICRGPAAYLHPASVLHRYTRNLLTRAAFADFQPFTCTQPAFQIDAQEIPSQAQHLQRSSCCLLAPSQRFT